MRAGTELRHGPHSARYEEEKDGVEEDISVEGDDSDVEDNDDPRQGRGREGASELPHSEEGEGHDGAAQESAAQPHPKPVMVQVLVSCKFLGLFSCFSCWNFTRFIEGKGSVVPCTVSHSCYHHLAEGWVHVKEESPDNDLTSNNFNHPLYTC